METPVEPTSEAVPALGPGARAALLLAGVLAAVAGLYVSTLNADFVWDDHALVEEHPAVVARRPLSEYLGRMFWSDPERPQSASYYRPLAVASFAFDHARGNGHPAPFHATNLTLHLLCCALVFALCRRAGAGEGAAAWAALAFGAFPRASEPVAWISGRTDVLAAAGALAACCLHRSEPAAWPRRLAAAAALLVGALGKEVAAAGAAALVALELARWRRGEQPGRRALVNLAPLLLAVCGYAALRGWAWRESGSGLAGAVALPWSERALLALEALGRYVAMLLDPLRPRISIGVLGDVDWRFAAAGSASAMLLALGLAHLARRGRPETLAALVLAAAALAPVLHLVPLPLAVVAADRFLYLPAAGIATALALASARLRGGARAAARLAAPALVLAFAWATAARVPVWKDDLALFGAAVPEAPARSPAAYAGLGEAYLRRNRFAEALPALEEALRRHHEASLRSPRIFGYPETVAGNRGLCLLALGRTEEAIAALEEVVRHVPERPVHRYNLALAHAHQLELDAAARELEAALTLHPAYAQAADLRAYLDQVRAEWAELPPPQPGEATAVKAARARIFARLGHRAAAGFLWGQVAAAADAPPETLRAAALYLVGWGDPREARRAVARLKALAPYREEGARLEEALAARLELEQVVEPS